MDLTASDAAALVYMIILQYVLFKIHRSKLQPLAPTSLEIFSLISITWIFYGALESAIWYIIGTEVFIFSNNDLTNQNVKAPTFSLTRRREPVSILNAAVHIFYISWTTWITSRSLVVLLEIIIPLLQHIRRDPRNLLLRFQMRCLELITFFRTMSEYDANPKPDISTPSAKFEKQNHEMIKQAITLERRQDHSPTENERVLNWNILVDKTALDEMKGTLGPSGGFGELGFNVAKDQVIFGAMGIGTSFNLTFELDKLVDEKNPDRDGRKSGSVTAVKRQVGKVKSK